MFVVWAAVAVFLVAAWPRFAASRAWRHGCLAGILALSLVHQLMLATLAEDAFISFRYALNLAEGNGLVFNVGERVEGYSNFLWVVLTALPHAVAGLDIVLVSRVLGIACALGCVVLAYVLTRRISGDHGAGLLAAVLTATASGLAAYGPSGLETPLFALLVLTVVLTLHADAPLVAGLLVALATMTRPDGALVALVVGLWLVMAVVRQRMLPRVLVYYALGVFALIVPWTAWRVEYYGHLIPNAIAAKAGASLSWQLASGWNYVTGFAMASQALLVLVPVALFMLLARRSTLAGVRSLVWLLFALGLTTTLFAIASGGDWMPGWRFLAPAMPQLAVAIGVSWATFQTPGPASLVSGRFAAVVAASAGLLMISVSAANASYEPAIQRWRGQVDELADLGRWVGHTLPAGSVISTFANGALSYEAGPGLTVVDQLGLTDSHIARAGKRLPEGVIGHIAYDYDYVVDKRRPDVVFVTGNGYLRSSDCAVPAPLAAKYVGRAFQIDGEQLWAVVYLRADNAEHLTRLLAADPRFVPVPCG